MEVMDMQVPTDHPTSAEPLEGSCKTDSCSRRRCERLYKTGAQSVQAKRLTGQRQRRAGWLHSCTAAFWARCGDSRWWSVRVSRRLAVTPQPCSMARYVRFDCFLSLFITTARPQPPRAPVPPLACTRYPTSRVKPGTAGRR